ncbi:MAG: glycosyltransferase [Gemmatimonadetes bacterium]|nr:glycosyltransferase [Gemmatimonadota bacterium]
MLLPILLALPWILFPVLLATVVRRRPLLAEWEPVRDAGAALVSVVVPARNEAHNIGTCVRSLLRTEYPNCEIVVVDDGSEDATSAIVEEFARADPRVRLVRGEPLPQGWFGKPWACTQGAAIARGEYLLFTDADVVHEPELVGRSVRALKAEGAALLTVLPRQILLGFWERLIMPQVLCLILLRYPDPERVNRSPRERDKIANGQYILVRRSVYEVVGGHGAVRHEVAEDLRLAHRFHRLGHRVLLVVADRFMSVRMYDSLAGIVEGWSKNVAIAARQTVPRAMRPLTPWLLVLWLLVLWVVPPVVLALGFAGIVSAAAWLWSALACGMALLFWVLVNRRLEAPLWYALLFPLGAAFAAGVFLKSVLQGNRVRWKGRAYHAVAHRNRVP